MTNLELTLEDLEGLGELLSGLEEVPSFSSDGRIYVPDCVPVFREDEEPIGHLFHDGLTWNYRPEGQP